MTGTNSRDNRDTPYTLWLKARDEHPTDEAARGRRHVELMREAGMIVPCRPGESQTLPCGWNPFTGRQESGEQREEPKGDDHG